MLTFKQNIDSYIVNILFRFCIGFYDKSPQDKKSEIKKAFTTYRNKMIHLIIGNTGSGKTTYSNKLKEEVKGIIFSIDKWNNTLFLPDKKNEDGLAWFLERIDRAELLMSNLILQLESIKTDSILDLGFSKFEHREKFRQFSRINKIDIKIHYLDISKKTRRKQVFKRNDEKGETFEFIVTAENFEFMENWFEKPNETELKNAIIISE